MCSLSGRKEGSMFLQPFRVSLRVDGATASPVCARLYLYNIRMHKFLCMCVPGKGGQYLENVANSRADCQSCMPKVSHSAHRSTPLVISLLELNVCWYDAHVLFHSAMHSVAAPWCILSGKHHIYIYIYISQEDIITLTTLITWTLTELK